MGGLDSGFYAASFNQIPLPGCRFGDYRDKEGNILKSLSSPRLQAHSPRPIMLETSAVSDPSRSGICVSQIHSKIRYIKGFRASQARRDWPRPSLPIAVKPPWGIQLAPRKSPVDKLLTTLFEPPDGAQSALALLSCLSFVVCTVVCTL